MSDQRPDFSTPNLITAFSARAQKPKKARKKRPAPISLRLSTDERAHLKQLAGAKSLNGYIRERLFGLEVKNVRRVNKASVADQQLLARLLRDIGTWDMSWALQEIDLAVEEGSIQLDPDTCIALRKACADIAAMRHDLMKALGLRSISD